MNNVRDVFSTRLTQLRLRTYVRKTQTAANIGISYRALRSYERGENIPNIEALVKICRYYKVSADWLLGLEGD